MFTPLSIAKYVTGGVACIMGVVLGGSAFENVDQVGTVTPFSSRPQIISTPQPDRGIQIAGGIALILAGGGLIAWGTLDSDDLTDSSYLEEPSSYPQINHPYQPQTPEEIKDPVTATNLSTQAPSRQIQSTHQASLAHQQTVPEVSEFEAPASATVNQNEPQRYYQPPKATAHNQSLSLKETTYTEKDSYADVRELVDEGSVQFVGGKGSGKTEKLCWLVAEHCKLGHWVWFVDPFAPASRYKGLRVFGRGLNYKEAAAGLREYVEEAKRRIQRRGIDPDYDPFEEIHIHLAIDEMSNYGDRLEAIDPNLMAEFWEINTQFLRQANMSVSMVSHGETQAMMGGEKAQRGRSKAIKQDTIRIRCQWQADPCVKGKRRCAGWAERVSVEAGDHEIKKRIDIPQWMVAPLKYDYSAIAVPVKIVDPSAEQKPTLAVINNNCDDEEIDVWAS